MAWRFLYVKLMLSLSWAIVMMAKHWLKYNKRWTSTYNTLYLIPSSFIVSFQSAKVKKKTTTTTTELSNANIFHSTTQHCSCSFLCTARYCFDAVSLCAKMLCFIIFFFSSPFQFDAFALYTYFAFTNPCYLVLPGLFSPCICALASVNICDLKIEEAPRVIRTPIVFNFNHIFGGNTVQNYVLDFSKFVCVCVHLIKIWASSRCSKILSSNSEKDRHYRIQSKVWNDCLFSHPTAEMPNSEWTHWVSG